MAEDDKSAEKGADLKELVKVYGPVEADVIRSFLESQGIACVLQGRMVQSVMPYTVNGLAEIRVLVAEKDLEAARLLLDSAKNFQDEDEEA
jgi:hypothetical protein